jgi:hypothetical protein
VHQWQQCAGSVLLQSHANGPYASSSRTRMAHTCFGLSGRSCPTMHPLFQAGRSARIEVKFGVSMTDPPIRHFLPQRQPDVDEVSLPRNSATHLRSGSSPYLQQFR